MHYVSRRDNETKIKVDEQYSNENTVVAEYLNGDKQGKTVSITHSTLKRWWKKVEEEQVQNEPLPMEEPEKIQESQEIKGIEKSPKSKKTMNKRIREKEQIKGRLTSYNSKYFENVKCYKIFKAGETKKPIAEVYPRRKHIEVRVKTVSSSVSIEYKEGYKYYLPVHYFIAYEHIDYLDIMETLLKSYL